MALGLFLISVTYLPLNELLSSCLLLGLQEFHWQSCSVCRVFRCSATAHQAAKFRASPLFSDFGGVAAVESKVEVRDFSSSLRSPQWGRGRWIFPFAIKKARGFSAQNADRVWVLLREHCCCMRRRRFWSQDSIAGSALTRQECLCTGPRTAHWRG